MSGAATLAPATAPQDEGRTAWETPAQVGGKGFPVLCLVWRYLLPVGLDRCYACPGMGIGDALVGPVATSSIQFVGQGYPFGMGPPGRSAPCASVGWGLPAETRASITPTPQQCPSRMAIGRARCSILLVSPSRAAVRRAGLDPMRPDPGPGTGPSSFLGKNHWQKPEYIIQYPARRTLTQGLCRHRAQTVRKTLSAGLRRRRPPLPPARCPHCLRRHLCCLFPPHPDGEPAPPPPAQHFQAGAPAPDPRQGPLAPRRLLALVDSRSGAVYGDKVRPRSSPDRSAIDRRSWRSPPPAVLAASIPWNDLPSLPCKLAFSAGACHSGPPSRLQTCCFPT